MSQLNSSEIVPLYIQLANKIKFSISDGTFKYQDQIPSELDMVTRYEVSRNTVRRAIDYLVEEGILIKKQGKGTYVKKQIFLEDVDSDGSFTSISKKMGSIAHTKIIEMKLIDSDGLDFEGIDYEFTNTVVYIKRLRLINDIPAIIEEDYLPQEYLFLLDLDMENKSLFDVIKTKKKISLVGQRTVLEAVLADKQSADLLNIKINSPLLKMGQVVYSTGYPVYFNIQYVNSTVYKSVLKSSFPLTF